MIARKGRAARTTPIIDMLATPAVTKRFRPTGGRDHADFHVYHHDDAQMDRIDAKFNGDREHQRCHDYQQTAWFHKLTANQQDDVYYDQEQDWSETEGEHCFGDLLRNLFVGNDVFEYQCIRDDEHQCNDQFASVAQCVDRVFMPKRRDYRLWVGQQALSVLQRAHVTIHIGGNEEGIN